VEPGYLDNLEEFLGLAYEHNIRVIVTLAEWGGNKLEWWHAGGEYWGGEPYTTGADSLDVLVRFWRRLGIRLAYNPTVFSYNMCVEWSMPNSNMTHVKEGEVLSTAPARYYWREFLRAVYEDDIEALNKAYGTEHASFTEVPVVDYAFDTETREYSDPEKKILDWQYFRQWSTNRYFKAQIEALRDADDTHMITIGNHSRQAFAGWPAAAKHTSAAVREQDNLVDYISIHNNIKPVEHDKVEAALRNMVLNLRFSCPEEMMPVMLEEYSFQSDDPEKVADLQEKLVLAAVGHASGTMGWFMRYPEKVSEGPSGIMYRDLNLAPWGERAKELAPRLMKMDHSRKEAKQTIETDRAECMVPKAQGPQLKINQNWDEYNHPVDFKWERNPYLNLKLIGER
jgi:hypothetical protein